MRGAVGERCHTFYDKAQFLAMHAVKDIKSSQLLPNGSGCFGRTAALKSDHLDQIDDTS